MAKYDQPRIAQLLISSIPENLTIDNYQYIMTATSTEAKKNYVSKKSSFERSKTHQLEIFYDTAIVQVDIYLNNNWQAGFKLKHYKNDASIKYDQASLKSTTSLNSKNAGHVKDLQISQNAEVGWKLIKKEQTFDSLLKEIYLKVPTHIELDIFRHANAHLSDLQDLNLNNKVKPGQIILVTNKKSSPELNEYKRLALEAERIFQFLCTQKGFDPSFYANNFELLMDYFSVIQQAQIAKIEYQKTVEGHKESYCGDVTLNKNVESLNAAAIYSERSKDEIDNVKVKRLNQDLIKQLNLDVMAIQQAKQKEIINKTKLANPKHDVEFRKKNYILYQKLENTISKNFVKMHDDREFAKVLKNIVKDTSGVRAEKYMGGLKLNVKVMETIGRATISLKIGSKLVLYFYIAESATKVYGAYQTGDMEYTMKVATVETLNVGGGWLGGIGGAALGGAIAGGVAGSKFGLILGIETGGASIVICGAIGAVIGGVAGGFAGNYIGTTVGREITGVCK